MISRVQLCRAVKPTSCVTERTMVCLSFSFVLWLIEQVLLENDSFEGQEALRFHTLECNLLRFLHFG